MVKVPADWDECSLSDLFGVLAGGDLKKSLFSPYRTQAYTYKIFSNAIENYGLYGYTSKPCYPADSITVTARGTIGKAYYRDEPFDAIIRLLVLVPKSKNVCTKFYVYYINHMVTFDLESTGVPQLTVPKIGEKKVPFFSKSEQQAIADTLSTFDTYISDITELIEKKRAIRDGALEDLVSGKKRMDGFDGEWKKGIIGDLLTIMHGKNQKSVEAFNGKYPILGTGGIIGQAKKYLCNWECVLIGRKGTIDQPMYMNKPFWSIDTLYFSKPVDSMHCVKFQFYLFCTIPWSDYTESSGRPSLAKSTIEAIPILIPSIKEQQAIADTLTAMDDEIRELEEERSKMKEIREGAMDDLLTGRVRLPL